MKMKENIGMKTVVLMTLQIFLFNTFIPPSYAFQETSQTHHLRAPSSRTKDGGNRELFEELGVSYVGLSVKDGSIRLPAVEGVRFVNPDIAAEYAEDILTPEALTELVDLTRLFRDRRNDLLRLREVKQKRMDGGEPIDFLPEDHRIEWMDGTGKPVSEIRQQKWKVSGLPPQLKGRYVQLTGPADQVGMVVNAMNTGQQWMADGEDAAQQTQDASLRTQRNLKLLNTWTDDGKRAIEAQSKRPLNPEDKLAILLYRPRGLHLDDRHLLIDGKPVPGAFVDAWLFLKHNAQALIEHSLPVILYLPKLESAEEADLWHMFLYEAGKKLDLDPGTVKVFTLDEIDKMTFQLEEVMYAFSRPIYDPEGGGAYVSASRYIGPNVGRWDYLASIHRTNRANPDAVPTDTNNSGMEDHPGLAEYEQYVSDLALKRGAVPWGGMSANILLRATVRTGDFKGLSEAAAGILIKKLQADGILDAKGNVTEKFNSERPLVDLSEDLAPHREMVIQVLQEFASRAYNNKTALEKARSDKERESGLRPARDKRYRLYYGAWVATPPMVSIIQKVFEEANAHENFEKAIGRGHNPKNKRQRRDWYTPRLAKKLRAIHKGPVTEAGLREDISIVLQYAISYLSGSAAAAVQSPQLKLHLMEDLATAEIRRAALWLRLHHGARIEGGGPLNGQTLTTSALTRLVDEETGKLETKFDERTVWTAGEILKRATTAEKLIPWFSDPLNIALDMEDPEAITVALDTFFNTYQDAEVRMTRPDLGPAFQERGDFKKKVKAIKKGWADQKARGRHLLRLHSAEAVAALQIDPSPDNAVQNHVAWKFYDRLRRHQENKTAINTFGPFDEASIEAMARMGIEGVYIGGWAESARAGTSDQARYAYAYVGRTVSSFSRHLQQHARHQEVKRSRMTVEQLASEPKVDFLLPLFVDIDTGHLAPKEMVESMMTSPEGMDPPLIAAVHIEDQAHGCKKCGHMSGKVLVSTDEHIKRMNDLRLQLDVMGLDTLIVARTDAEAAEFITSNLDERDHHFILGATKRIQPYHEAIQEARARGIPEEEVAKVHKEWKQAAVLMTLGEAVARAIQQAERKGEPLGITVHEWRNFAKTASNKAAKAKAKEIGIHVYSAAEWELLESAKPEMLEKGINILWDWDLPRTEELERVFWMIQSGTEMAIARSKAYLPYADISWMEQHHPNVEQVKEWADALIEEAERLGIPQPLLANNTSPSFYWRAKHDGKMLSNEDLKIFLKRQGEAGIQFNFITYGGSQLNHYGVQRFISRFRDDGMLAWADFQDEAIQGGDAFVQKSQKWAGVDWNEARDTAGRGGIPVASPTGERDTMLQFDQALRRGEEKARDGGSRDWTSLLFSQTEEGGVVADRMTPEVMEALETIALVDPAGSLLSDSPISIDILGKRPMGYLALDAALLENETARKAFEIVLALLEEVNPSFTLWLVLTENKPYTAEVIEMAGRYDFVEVMPLERFHRRAAEISTGRDALPIRRIGYEHNEIEMGLSESDIRVKTSSEGEISGLSLAALLLGNAPSFQPLGAEAKAALAGIQSRPFVQINREYQEAIDLIHRLL